MSTTSGPWPSTTTVKRAGSAGGVATADPVKNESSKQRMRVGAGRLIIKEDLFDFQIKHVGNAEGER